MPKNKSMGVRRGLLRLRNQSQSYPLLNTSLVLCLFFSLVCFYYGRLPQPPQLLKRTINVDENSKIWEAATKKCAHPRKNSFVHRSEVVVPGNCSLGWDIPGTINSGQNLEDAVIFTRFFSGSSPLSHLSRGNGNGQQVGGIFLEMGALDGVTFSNTRFYEYCAGWDGILIEAQPDNAKKLFENRPCAVVIPEGVCSVASPGGSSSIRMSLQEGTAYDLSTRGESSEASVEVPCRPLSQILQKHGVTRINFFSLDVEGAELKILETFDFEKVKIDVLMVEADFISAQNTVQTDNAKVEAVRNLIETRSNMKRVPSRLDEGKTDKRLCERNGKSGDDRYCMFLSIAGSDVFVSPELYEYDTKPWMFTG